MSDPSSESRGFPSAVANKARPAKTPTNNPVSIRPTLSIALALAQSSIIPPASRILSGSQIKNATLSRGVLKLPDVDSNVEPIG